MVPELTAAVEEAAHPATQRASLALGRVLASLDALRFRRWGDGGLTITQLRVLYRLRGDARASAGEIADHLAVTPSTVTAIVERLVQRGLVARGGREGDRRVTELGLTPLGREMVEEAARSRQSNLRHSFDLLSVAEREQLARLLDKLAVRLQEREAATAQAVPEVTA
jgi:MarR family transcriptional regulator, organic hydroperoxide resistance regulator